MKKVFVFLLVLATLFTIHYSLFTREAQAVCPVCTAAVIGGLGLSRLLGIDDSVSGVWVGGLILSLSFWTVDWINRKGYFKKFLAKVGIGVQILISFILYYLITFVPMFATDFIGHPINKIWGIDKLVFGSVIGTGVFLLGVYLDKKQRKIYGKQFFEFQRVVFPVVALLAASAILYLITKHG